MSSFVLTNRFCAGVENSGLELKDIETIFINERGDKMRGNLNMNGNKIINVSNPINNDEVVNEEYIDEKHKDLKYSLKNILDKKD